ncbi:MAG: peptidase M16 [Deltaproteobacteria bacterium]|nr:MAG: peptidase M16 [Deltaproteobacteria bacterium]
MTVAQGFVLKEERRIEEIASDAFIYEHEKTGARVLSIVNDDENKVFGITFRTPPKDSTGVAHILEHSVLCGSRKYPVKEPFVELLKGSLQTFLNAMTFPDKTCYPVASQNVQDFYHLIDVYLDAVFYPRITPEIFEQEGWHYELERPEDPLIYKGVVFNEMKGVYSSPDSLLAEYSQHALFPHTLYGLESGGHPEHIPELTYEAFKEFHTTYYHPSNAWIYFYGDDDPGKRLELLAAYLDDFSAKEVTSSIPLQPTIQGGDALTYPFAAGADQIKGMTTVNWLLCEAVDVRENLSLHILEHILVGMPGSPLRKALIDSGLGEDLAGFGLEDELRQMMFSLGLKGIDPAKAGRVKELILATLRDIRDQGMGRDLVEAGLNTIEFALRENNTGSYPRGLLVMLRSLSTWLYDGDPLEVVCFESALTSIKEALARGERIFEDLITSWFLDNPHQVQVVLTPDQQLGKALEAAEAKRLAAVKQAMTDQDIQAVIARTAHLKELQAMPDAPEDLATLPFLTKGELEPRVKTVPLEKETMQGATVLFHDLATSGIVYVDIALDLHHMVQKYLPYVPLFGRALFEMGTDLEDYVEFGKRIRRTTGGIGASPFSAAVQGQRDGCCKLILRGKAMADHTGDLMDIVRDALLRVNLDDKERFRQIVIEEKVALERALVPSGHALATLRVRSRFHEADWAQEQMGGISYLFFLRFLLDTIDTDWDTVLGSLRQIQFALVDTASMLVNVTTSSGVWKDVRPYVEGFLLEMPEKGLSPNTWLPVCSQESEGLTMPTRVNYVAKGMDLYAGGYTYHGSVSVITKYLRTSWLWEQVRVLGGAYGGFCGFDRQTGLMTFGSYRDPNLLATLEAFDKCAAFLAEAPLDQAEIDKGIIGAIGGMDQYQLPDAKGFSSMIRFLTGVTDEERQKIRDEILATDESHFRAFAATLGQCVHQGFVAVLGSAEGIAEAREKAGLVEIVDVL